MCWVRNILSLVLLLTYLDCTNRILSPTDSLLLYADALERKDYHKMYELMSNKYKKRISYKEFLKIIKENPKEVKSLIKLLQYPPEAVIQRTIIEYDSGERLILVLEDGEWKIDSNIFDFYNQSTPLRALYSFVRAIKNKRYNILLRFIPKNIDVEIYDKRATIRYYKNHEVHLILEDGLWKIESWN